MPLATATVTFNLADLLGVALDARRTRVWVTTNIPDDTVVDTDGNKIRLGSGKAAIDANGAGSFTVWVPGAGSNPASWQTYVHVDYIDNQRQSLGRRERTFGPFTITANADLADLVQQAVVPPAIMGGDAYMATVDADGSSQYRQQADARLSATIAPLARKSDSPRDTQRVKDERKPILRLDRQSPNATWGDLKLLSVANNSMYAIGQDRTLRSSSDAGASWYRLAQGNGGEYARFGMFYRASTAGTIITTWHPDGGGAPEIRRSTNYGSSFSTVVAAETDVDYLGSTSVCQDPVTGYLYLGQYIIVNAATKATLKVKRSTDNGATWTDFQTWSRDATANPTTAVRHVHGIQWDQHGQRIWVITGDAENACGLYRVNSGGTGLEAVLRKDSQSVVPAAATAVGVMFFPTHIAWGQDQTADAWLLRMARTQIGQPNPVVERIMHVQSCAWYTVRTKTDGTEWLMCASNQPGADVEQLDRMIHVYRVADNGASCDEVAAFPTNSLTATNYFQPLDTPLQANDDEYVWINTNVRTPFEDQAPTTPIRIGQQYKVALGWGVQAFPRADVARRPWVGHPITFNSGKVTLAAGATHTFGAIIVPANCRRLFIFDLGATKITGSGAIKVRVWDASGATAVLNGTDSLPIETTLQSILYYTYNENEAAPNVRVSAKLTAGRLVYFDLIETGGASTADAVAHVQFAFGY